MRRTAMSLFAAVPLALGGLIAVAAPSNAADTDVQINEIESSGGWPEDWVELKNTGAAAVDISGWRVRDEGGNNNNSSGLIPAGTVLAAGAYYVAEFPAGGLGGGDTARVFAADGTTLVDTHAFPDHAQNGTWSACPEGPGDTFTDRPGSKGLSNDCTSVKTTWPGGTTVTDVDSAGGIGDDFSGIAYEGSGTAAPGTIWGVSNGDGTLRKFTSNGALWSEATPWNLHYAGGLGQPDAEGITVTDAGASGGLYIATERDGLNGGVSRPAVLRVVPSGVGGNLSATNTWDLADITGLGANASLEAVAWVPDSYLTSTGFKAGATAYNPAAYANHGTGLFFVGVEQTGEVIGYALNHVSNTATRVVTIPRMMNTVTDLVYDPETRALWASCDDNCNGRVNKLGVDGTGSFVSLDMYERPTGGANLNNEGFTIASRTECVGGVKPVFWADDGNDNGHALRAGTVSCTAGTAPTITGAAASSKARTAAGWYGAPVTVTFTCTPGSAPLSGGCPTPVTLSTSGANQSVSGTVRNGDFAAANASVTGINIDLVAPTVKIAGVKKGKTYPKKKKPKCVGTDALSGISSCTVTQKKKGSKYKVTATATDKAGNVTVVTLTYKVKKTARAGKAQ